MHNILHAIESIVIHPLFTFIIGVIIAVFFHYRGKKVKSPSYAIRSSNIVRDLVSKIKSLEMLYDGRQIKNLTVTKIAFWNAGKDTINSEDIPTAEPLTVRIKEGYKILDAKIHSTNNSANQLSISTSDDQLSANIEFEYLDKGEGGVFQLIHTGINDESIEFHGLIKGAGSPIKKNMPNLKQFYSPKKSYRVILAILLFGSPLILIAQFILNPVPANAFDNFTVVLMYWILGIYLFKRRLPKGFEGFEDDF